MLSQHKNIETAFRKIRAWQVRNLSNRYFVILLAAIIGFLAGIAAYLMKTGVFLLEDLLVGGSDVRSQDVRFFLFPLLGVFLTILFVRLIIRDDVAHGIPRILYVISKRKGVMKRHKSYSSLIGGTLTAGFGGSAGLESPIISTGSTIGSTIGQYLRMDFKTTTLLIGCGAAGAIASIFTTPLAAVIFSLEVLMLDLSTASIIPLLMASVTGALTTKMLFAEQMVIHFELHDPFLMGDVPFFILLGVITGLVSLYFNRIHFRIAKIMGTIKNVYFRALAGLSLLGLLIFLFPPLYGEGYEAIKTILSGNPEALLNNSLFFSLRDNMWFLVAFVAVLILFKVIATTLTTESGGIGGIFAPGAVMGGFTGFLLARTVNDLNLGINVSESNFTLVGMAGVLGGILHAPLTAIFLIAEITSGYELFVPLMLTSAVSFLTIKYFDPHSIFTRELAERGELLTHHKDKTVLTLLNVKELVDTDPDTISPGMTIGELTKVIAKTRRNIFPVLREDGSFMGLVVMDDIREVIFKAEEYNSVIDGFIIQPPTTVAPDEPMESVMEKFNQTGLYNLPVIDKGKYVGFVSRSNIFSAYRKMLLDVSLD